MTGIVVTILEIIAALLPFVIDWKERQPTREAEENIQNARRTLAKTDGAAFDALAADQHDRVRLALSRRR